MSMFLLMLKFLWSSFKQKSLHWSAVKRYIFTDAQPCTYNMIKDLHIKYDTKDH